jgi:periplasmic divalent cation tolerance protein
LLPGLSPLPRLPRPEIMLIIFTATPNEAEAENLAKQLIEQKLAACVQVLPKMKSFYFWKDELQIDSEHLVLIKTIDEKYAEVESFIKANTGYEVPEIISVKSDNVSADYLNWLENHLNS